MSIKIYNKSGRKNYIENRYVNELTEIIEQKIQKNPSLLDSFRTAETFEELEKMYYLYTSQEGVIESETNNIKSDMAKSKAKNEDEEFLNDDAELTGDEDEIVSNSSSATGDDEILNDFVDPFNREEPIVRDYVLDGGDLADPNAVDFSGKTDFDEPTSFDEAFVLPDDSQPASSSGGGGGYGGGSSRQQPEPEPEPREHARVNPDFDDMSSAKKRKSTKKFAKYIVETVCMLSEKGFVWYANKDINEAKLVEYELKGEMDLSLLLNMPDGQEVTVKQFFLAQCLQAEELAEIGQEEKNDLTDALAEVLLEKGIAPTPTQELLLIAAKVFVGQAISLMTLKASTNSVLAQLRAMKQAELSTEEIEYNDAQTSDSYTAYEFERSAPQPQPQQEPTPQPKPKKQRKQEDSDEMIRLLEANDPLGSEIQTIE